MHAPPPADRPLAWMPLVPGPPHPGRSVALVWRQHVVQRYVEVDLLKNAGRNWDWSPTYAIRKSESRAWKFQSHVMAELMESVWGQCGSVPKFNLDFSRFPMAHLRQHLWPGGRRPRRWRLTAPRQHIQDFLPPQCDGAPSHVLVCMAIDWD